MLGLLLIVFLFGCSSGRVPPKGIPKLYPCLLTVTQEGAPLAGAVVRLHLQGTLLDWTVSGTTDETGTVTIYTDGFFAGAPAGEFKVTVEKFETVAPPMPEVLPTNPDALQKLSNRIEAETKDYRLVEPVYGKADSTPLSISVNKKKTEASFDVGKKYRELAQ